MNYFIVNDIDRPYEKLIAAKNEQGLLDYLDSELKERYKDMEIHGATPLEDFGFAIAEDEKEIRFQLCNESVAKYTNGETRSWQGQETFTIKKEQ